MASPCKRYRNFILGRYLLLGILLILLSVRPWGVAARPAILVNKGGKSHFRDYFIIRARLRDARVAGSIPTQDGKKRLYSIS
jgi:hypothetical protein